MFKQCTVISVLFLAQVLAKATSESPDDVRALLDALKDQAQTVIENATHIMNEAAWSVQIAAAPAEDEAQIYLKASADSFMEQVDLIKQAAATIGVDIQKCLTGNEKKLEDLPYDYFRDLIFNISSKVTEGISHAADTLNKIKEVETDIANFEQELEDCKKSSSSADCFSDLALRISTEIENLQNRTNEYIEQGQALTEAACTDIENLASNAVQDFKIEGAALVDTIHDCVIDIINSSTKN